MPDLHPAHDLATVVAFVDAELSAAETEAVRAQIEACPDCAALAHDLRAFAIANRAIPTPARTRDFQLTPADAARLGSIVATHATHDPERVTAYLDGALAGAERPLVAAWLTSCDDCARLRDDLVAISAAHRALPTPPRPADYRLSETDAAALGRSRWRGLLARIGTSSDLLTRPLATGLTALGIVGLLISAGPLAPLGGSSASVLSTVGAAVHNEAPQAAQGNDSGKSAPTRIVSGPGVVDMYAGESAVPSAAAGLAVPPSSPSIEASGTGATPDKADDAAAPDPAASTTALPAPDGRPIPLLPIVSGAVLAAGLALYALRRLAPRSVAP